MAARNELVSAQKIGVVLVIISALLFSTAGIFTNGVTASAWGIIFWRGLAAALFIFIYLFLTGRLWREIDAFAKPTAFVTILMAAGTAAFIPAFKLSSVANVVLIYAASPFVAAALSWFCIHEAPTRKVIVASMIAFLGVLVVVSGSIGTSNIWGDVLALFMTFALAATMVIYRAYPATTAALPSALSSLLLLPLAAIFGRIQLASIEEHFILLMFGVVFAVASVTLAEGARRLPPAETALLSTVEVPVAPLLAWIILSETPSAHTFIGGGLILFSVIWSQMRSEVMQNDVKR